MHDLLDRLKLYQLKNRKLYIGINIIYVKLELTSFPLIFYRHAHYNYVIGYLMFVVLK